MKQKKGITLIALIITILVILILAVVSINLIIGENGLLNNSKLAQEKYINAQLKEEAKLSEFEKEMLLGARNDDIKNDLTVTAKNLVTRDVEIQIDVEQEFENAAYIYIVNNKMVSVSQEKTAIAKNLEPNVDVNITVIVVEENETIHRGTTTIKTRTDNLDVFGHIQASGKTFADYGITYTRTGHTDAIYDELYGLGMYSSNGTNSITFSLTIDYSKLKLGNNNYKGIMVGLMQQVSRDSWVYTDVIITYTDSTTTKITTDKSLRDSWSTADYFYPCIKFEEGKSVGNIKVNMYGRDGDGGSAFMQVKNIELIP